MTTQMDYTYSEQLIHEIIETMRGYMGTRWNESMSDRLYETYVFARDAHGDQKRKSGEPYITHPLEAAKLLLLVKPDIISIQSCILHDVIEDTPKDFADIEKSFGIEVAHICEWLSKLSAIKYRGEERTIESLRKMLIAMVDDLRVIIVKLADRLHNMQTLEFHPDPKKRERIALETLNIYAPIADRLGIFNFKEMLETECFRILYPDEYTKILGELAELKDEQEFFLTEARKMIEKVIDPATPIIDISYRIKSPFSIYRKLSRKEYSYSHARDLYDLFAIRIITKTIPNCYEVLGVLHNVFVPMPKRFKDYIALPKENGYQSLHTTVVGLFGDVRTQPTEIQIRTESMHRQAEVWVAAHFEYSETGQSGKSKDSYWVETIKNIALSGEESGDFMTDMKLNVFADQIFVFTPKWDIMTLPKGATPVDFAYSIHSRLGNQLTMAKVNWQVVPLDYQLHSGESVQVITDINKKPKPIWLSFVKTPKAREYIRQFINREEREFFVEKGRTILATYLKKNYDYILDKELSILKNIDGHNLDTKKKEDVLVQLGNLSRKPVSILKAIHDEVIHSELGMKKSEMVEVKVEKTKKSEKKIQEEITVIIGKERDIPYKFAQCCNPTVADRKIVWAIGQGIVTIHSIECENVSKIGVDRRIPVRWSDEKENTSIVFVMECDFRDKKWLLLEITKILYNAWVNIKSVSSEILDSSIVRDRFTLEIDDEDYYIYERIEARMRFEIPELIETRLVSMT
jgi:GTP diphosphokinase / guanosine-3',5'-bis(diphosphate) 3'-diphosphatase